LRTKLIPQLAIGAAALFALSLPFVAYTQQAPQVTVATPGTSGINGGAINRYTLRFSEAMVPLGDPRAKAPAKLTCSVPAEGRWADQQTYVYEFTRPLPGGLSCDIELNAGLKSARGITVEGTRTFNIDTGGPSTRAALPEGGDIEEDQVFLIATNTPANPASVQTAGYCAVDGIGDRIPLQVLGNDVAGKLLMDLGEDDWDSRNFLENAGLPRSVPANAAERANALKTILAVKCQRPLPPGKDISVVWGSGIAGVSGRTAGRDQRYDYSVRSAFSARFECSRVNPQAGCNPVQDAAIKFTADVPVAQAKAIKLSLADGTTVPATLHNDDKNNQAVDRIYFKGPFLGGANGGGAGVGGKVEIPANLADFTGRRLTNASRFPLPVRIDPAPPLVKFASDFGIIEAKEGGVLSVTVRAVEPKLAQGIKGISVESLRIDASDGEIARWLRDIDAAADDTSETRTVAGKKVEINTTGTRQLLTGNNVGKSMALDLPGKGKDFEVIGIPLKDPGFYVVELASPTLGRALLDRPVTRYVAAGALVTNMAVHFKWGRDRSLAWVTSLDTGKPVASADVRVTDSCSGKELARGATDAQGRLAVNNLPEPKTGASNCKNGSSALMVSARSSGDFSFTMTQWNDGIAPYDFDLPFGWNEDSNIIHTVFDRTLVKQGETINMKHIQRKPVSSGFGYAGTIKGTLRITHSGSDTEFEMPINIGNDGIGENSWTVPKAAPMGDYRLSIKSGGETYRLGGFQVDEYRLPTMKASVTGPKEALIKPAQVPLDLFVGYLSGGGAANMPVSIRTAYSHWSSTPTEWDDYNFGGRPVGEATIKLNSDNQEMPLPLPLSQNIPLSLGGNGAGRTVVDITKPIETDTTMTVEMDYQDANGETLTTSRYINLLPSAVRLGVKTDGWMMKDDDLRLRFVALDPNGKRLQGKTIKVDVYAREILTARRRLIGGFYAYDNQLRTRKLGVNCSPTTDRLGMATCSMAPGISGEVEVVATTSDGQGNIARANTTVWLAGDDDWWFGGDNGDRMDLIPEAKSYKAGDVAKFQVRMPYREATALVTVEREGVMSSFVTELSGKDPVVSVPLPAGYAPDVFVSVMAVRGRVGGWKLWTAEVARDWGLPFLSQDGYKPTALVDLAKPSYRIGMTKVKVGWDGYKLGVNVKADKARYSVRETAQVDVQVTEPSGKPARSAEIAFAAVDEALLQLQSNQSWDVLSAMMGERPNSVVTSTAQMQVVGKRHYGKKAVEAGGGGGVDASNLNRDDFKPVLLWKGRVPLDAQGRARIPVQMNESLSAFRLVAVATSGPNLFGSGQTSVRTAQDLSIFSGLPPLVRTGDEYGATFTLRNTTDKAMTVTATAKVIPAVQGAGSQQVTIPSGGAVPVTWTVVAPEGVSQLAWTVDVKGGKISDSLALVQDVVPAVPVEIWAGTLMRAGPQSTLPLQAPAGAIPGVGYVDVKLSDTLAPPLEGVRRYMTDYPYTCFEQQTSRIIVLDDRANWDRLAKEIPTYLDSDGLLKYWPIGDMKGSETLTAYILSVTAEAGLPIADADKDKMLTAMKSVLDGRVTRSYGWSNDTRLFKVAALSALARHGRATPAMLGQISIAPADMPTTVLADWLATIDRVKGANAALRTTAENILRQRIVYEGTRLDLVDKANAPWWMMSSGDEMSLRALHTILGRPGWSAEEPKMMVGAALRQQKGRWDTTTANVWGTLATRKFAKLYPATAITGVSTISLGSESKTQNWPMVAGTQPLRFGLPMVQTPMILNHGEAGPWATVSLSAAVPLKAPLFAGYRVKKEVMAVQQASKGQWTRGDVAKVRITVNAGAGRNWVVISDPLIPGATVVGNLGGQSQLLAAEASGSGAWPNYTERGKDAFRAYYEWVPEGEFSVEYVVRLNGTGKFTLPPTRVEAMYSPEIRGQLPNAPVQVRMN
jgi:alpha-2-macroglobulin